MKPTITFTKKPKKTIIFTPNSELPSRKVPLNTIAMKNALQNKLNPLSDKLS